MLRLISAPWIVRPKSLKVDLKTLIGPSDYDGHAGAYSGGANGVYWVRIIKKVAGGVLIQNVAEKSKHGLPVVERTVEVDLLYPLIRWSDVSRYNAAPSVYLLLAQDVKKRTGIDESIMKRGYSKTYAYLKEFQSLLVQRAAYKRYQSDAPFYSMYDIDTYTLAPIKVVWRRMDRQINAAVVETIDDPYLGKKPVIPQETCVLIEAHTIDEAHYICGFLNSSIVNFIVKSHSVRGGKGFGTPSMLDYIRLKRFKPNDTMHKKLSVLSHEAHQTTSHGRELVDIQTAIDEAVASFWGLSATDMKAIYRSLDQ
jgi:hypothetical protein